MPLFLIFYRDKYGRQKHCVMLCTLKNLRQLMRKKRGFTEPEKYGHIIYNAHSDRPDDTLFAMLKARYDFDLDKNALNTPGFF